MPNLRGTLTANGYVPPNDVTVYWWHPSSHDVIAKKLNPNVALTSHFDLIGRYGEGDVSLAGWQTYPAVSSESGGGEAFPIIKALYASVGIHRDPTDAEWVDATFAELAKQGELGVGCDGYAVVGLPVPEGCVDSGTAKPGQPAITSLTSPHPGVVRVAWRSKPNNQLFVVKLVADDISYNRGVAGGADANYETEISGVVGGSYVVTVTAYIGTTMGAPSIAKTVAVDGGEVVVTPPPPPIEPPPPVLPPPPDKAVLSADSKQTIADWRKWVSNGARIGSHRKDRITAVFDEVEHLLG